MAFQNIFALGACNVYVRYKHSGSDVPGQVFLVPIADLDPGIGTVEVVGNLVVCDFTTGSGDGDTAQPEIVVMPQYDTSESTAARVTESAVTDQRSFVSYTANIGTLDDMGGGEFSFDPIVSADMTGAVGSASATIASALPQGLGVNVILLSEGI